jgi:serine/threonine-protein kinase
MDQQWYAVKVLPNRGVLKLRNAKQIVRDFKTMTHPAVVPFADAGVGGASYYLAWPFAEGEPLHKVVERSGGRLPPGLVAHYGQQAAEGLAVCHEKAITHGLLKPANLLIRPDHGVRILDLGIGALLSQEESIIHTGGLANLASGAECASPESALDPTSVGPASDQYSLGCVLYFCLTGQYPFEAGNYVDLMMLHQTQPPTPPRQLNPAVPPELEAVIQRMMGKQPADRYPTMWDVVAALRPLAQAGEAAPQPAAPAPTPARQRILEAAQPTTPARPRMAPPVPPAPAPVHRGEDAYAPPAAPLPTPGPQPWAAARQPPPSSAMPPAMGGNAFPQPSFPPANQAPAPPPPPWARQDLMPQPLPPGPGPVPAPAGGGSNLLLMVIGGLVAVVTAAAAVWFLVLAK